MDMRRFGFRRSALRALIATAAVFLAVNAHAQDPCEQSSSQDPSLQVLSQGIRVPLKFGGCWQPGLAVTCGLAPPLGLANPPPPILTKNTVFTASGGPSVTCSAQA